MGQIRAYGGAAVLADDPREDGHSSLAGRCGYDTGDRHQLRSGPGVGPVSSGAFCLSCLEGHSLWFFSGEHEQQVGSSSASGVIFPADLSSILTTQYNTGSNELKVPNMTPDFVFKAAFNGKLAGRTTLLDIGTLFRVFRNYAPSSGGGFSGKSHAGGFGVNAGFHP